MAIERCDRCDKYVDLDKNVDDIIYCDIKGGLFPICTDCLEQDNELCPDCGEYRPENECNCSEEVING